MGLFNQPERLEGRITSFKKKVEDEYSDQLIVAKKRKPKFPINQIALFLTAYDPREYALFRATSFTDAIKEFGYSEPAPVFRNDGVKYEFYLGFVKDLLKELRDLTGLNLDLVDSYSFVFWWTWKKPEFNVGQIKNLLSDMKANGIWTDERIAYRRQMERSARGLLDMGIENISRENAKAIVEFMDRDYEGKEIGRGRFGGAFYSMNVENMLSDMKEFRKWASDFYEIKEDEVEGVMYAYFDESNIKGTKVGLPSIVLYLKDNEKYNIMFSALTKGLSRISNYRAPSSIKAEDYSLFNRFAL